MIAQVTALVIQMLMGVEPLMTIDLMILDQQNIDQLEQLAFQNDRISMWLGR